MVKKLTLDDIAKLVIKTNDKVDSLNALVIKNQEHTNAKFDGLTETMIKRFDEVYVGLDLVETKLDKIEFNTSAQERRLSILEDKMRIVGTKLGLDLKSS